MNSVPPLATSENTASETECQILSEVPRDQKAHATEHGVYVIGDSLKLLSSEAYEFLHGKVDLIMTSPPFPLNKKKSYGNLQGEAYLEWFAQMGPIFTRLLSDTGSVVIELGNSWEPGRPVQSLLHLEALMSLVKQPGSELRLIQQCINHNPSRLPSPAQWVTVERCRLVDSFTHVWWLAKTDTPNADNRRVLRPYSRAMKNLLKRGAYNSGKRPSNHSVTEGSFLKDQGGAIAHDVIEVKPINPDREYRPPDILSLANTASNDAYHRICKQRGITPHPARMHPGLAAFFIQFLTEANGLVVDPFAGSNTTGFVAEMLGRSWLSFDVNDAYADHSKVRFDAREEA